MTIGAAKFPMTIPYRDNREVMDTAARLLRDTRRQRLSNWSLGLASLEHCQDVARHLVLSYVKQNNQGGFEYALLYARVEEVFAAWAYRLSMAESSVTYRELTKKA
jgi:hypothetical protein